ncbi:hypothetical protein AUEXF2481DRAFT_361950 [Aureobasidium subglaciale EXF-2481]|uniref:Uncharacterized protein n=1 Tax=Aureobasidium subglaciale (strain EXF-2481) TaxID=1043005 RepID=A0A074Y4V7_AURSE|nr:uncharacterized protein AUEXF2481DRAFT_361950 [Aureobasidium subglaciale EXF-2481]KAI5217188.1 hypothetical protein E4T40_07552 [Aureobasidium subglaciale]KEQ92823.1 hypothetical protein AUEXF2481DRAFT_361950 [Aureobasidium subglaciale EXF-2481]
MAELNVEHDSRQESKEMLKTSIGGGVELGRLHREPYHLAAAGAMLQAVGATSFSSALCADAPSRILLIAQRTVIVSALLIYLIGVAAVIHDVRLGRVRWPMMFFKALAYAHTSSVICSWYIEAPADWRVLGAAMPGTAFAVADGLVLDRRFDENKFIEPSLPFHSTNAP